MRNVKSGTTQQHASVATGNFIERRFTRMQQTPALFSTCDFRSGIVAIMQTDATTETIIHANSLSEPFIVTSKK